MNELLSWFHDDITWCAYDECPHINCERNIANMMDRTRLHSYAIFKDTEACPYYKENKDGK